MNKNIPWNLIIDNLRKDINDDEKNTLDDWLADPHNHSLYVELCALWDEICEQAGSYTPDISYYWEKLESRITSEKKEKRAVSLKKFKTAVAAASILLIISVSFLIGKRLSFQEPVEQRITAQSGKSSMMLPDGSTVWINIGTTLTFATPFIQNRIVRLDGEALFEVKKDTGHPFLVYIDDVYVKVHGTRFNIQAYKDDSEIRIALLDGKVSVWANEKETEIKPGEIASYHKQTHLLTVNREDVMFESFWADKSFSFHAKPLGYICKYLEKWYNVHIDIDPSIAESQIYTFTITDEPLESILQIMSRINPIYYSFEENRKVIIKNVKPLK